MTKNPEKLPYELFLQTFKHVHCVGANLIVTNEKQEVLLIKR